MTDLEPLKQLPLSELFLTSTLVTSLAALRDLPLTRIDFDATAVSDLEKYHFVSEKPEIKLVAGDPRDDFLAKIEQQIRGRYQKDRAAAETILQSGGSVIGEIVLPRSREFGPITSVAALPPAQHCFRLTRLTFGNEAVVDPASVIASLTDLEQLGLPHDAKQSLQCIEALETLPKLRELSLRSGIPLATLAANPVTLKLEQLYYDGRLRKRDLLTLQSMSKLTRLDLNFPACSSTDLAAALSELKALESLSLAGLDIDDQFVVEVIGSLPGLRELYIASTSVTGQSFQALRGLRLERLRVDSSPLAAGVLRHLVQLPIERLHLEDIDAASLVHLAGLPRLEVLTVLSESLTNDSIRTLVTLTNLRQLTLFSSQLSDGVVEHLGKMTFLEQLDLRNTRISEAAEARLRNTLETTLVVPRS